MALIYKHDYHPLSIYGNIVSLLREHVSCSGLHLDIGCGYGAIAEPIRDEAWSHLYRLRPSGLTLTPVSRAGLFR
jgi:hypothetical protein